ncbi:SMI1/KNR4 family protein [Massilia sp. CCM 8734]|uniref:SMI1/KNR4 family protein n=1 Tax=Massilia sp. CCM 8734 TaxID=2609283 RepID=UPI00142468F2|nr:SMI1/KNR4 family protein [Massilia sp. CCM 8734]NHZ94477.1 hypothetical protein [Massilia sp. CCM 8734]
MPFLLTRQLMLDDLARFIRPALLMETPVEVDPALPVPAQWVAILHDQQQGRKLALGAYWNKVAARMPAVLNFLHTFAKPLVVLVEHSKAVSLLYPFTAKGKRHFYRGHPALRAVPAQFQTVWPRIPAQLRDFYMHIHNGWTFLSANSMGPLPVEDWAFLSDDRFDIDDDTAASMPCDISKVLTVFHNGGGDYLCLDFSAPDGVATGLIWWHEEPDTPEVVDFWAYLDAWISIYVDDADSVDMCASRGGTAGG